jgi:Gas vesicle synthesis protein GvpL/GvpF
VIELIAITDDDTPPEPPLRTIRCDGLSVVCAPAREGEADAEALWQREEQLERLMESRDLLPVRFGTVVADENAAVAAIAPRGEALARALDRVRGAVEVSVRAVAQRPSETPAAGGAEYLRERVAEERVARRVHEPLAALARDSVLLDGPEALRAAYLVERGGVGRFVELFRELQREHPELAVVCTGPWPPYSFTDGEEQ